MFLVQNGRPMLEQKTKTILSIILGALFVTKYGVLSSAIGQFIVQR